MRLIGSLVMAVVTVPLCACGSSKDPKAVPPPVPRDAASEVRRSVQIHNTEMKTLQLPEPKIDLPKQESFKLVSPGAGARTVLRYNLAATPFAYRVETKLTSRHLEDSAWTKPIEIPAIRDGFAIAATPVGLALRPLAVELGGPATGETEQYTTGWRTQIQNRRVTAGFDDRGQLGAVTFNDDPTTLRTATARDEVVQRLLGTFVPVPVEPVGVGAAWQVTTILRQGHAFVKQTGTYTLTARDAKRWTIGVKLLRVGEEQRVSNPSLPAGSTVDLVAMFRVLEGTLVIDPQKPLGTGTLTVESRLHARITMGRTPAIEQLLEDLGTVRLYVEPETAAPAGSGSGSAAAAGSGSGSAN